MAVFPEFYRIRFIQATAGAPAVVNGLLRDLSAGDARWDDRSDPDRFTLREVAAHLADLDAVWLDRFTRCRDEDNPTMLPVDPDKLAAENDYAHSDPQASLAVFAQRRANLVEFLASLPESDWERAAISPMLGRLTLQDQAAYVLAHDGYHTRQIAEYLVERR